MDKNSDLLKILDFFRVVIRLKETYRFTPKGENVFENDAEHSWSVVMLCMLIGKRVGEELKVEIDVEKMLKMAALHDIAEVITGDTKTWDSNARVSKEERERRAVTEMFQKLPNDLRDEFIILWEECEARSTVEAKIVKSLDRVEPVLHRVLLNYGWGNFGKDDPEKTVAALDERQLVRHEFSNILTQLYKEIRQEALDRKMLE
ncbi:MAG TPA: HD domain-containing protein [Candidatus Dojkabacteria bacterium]|nr:HD domain-containing protein [Candidatus Dojkabacteria bacterium]